VKFRGDRRWATDKQYSITLMLCPTRRGPQGLYRGPDDGQCNARRDDAHPPRRQIHTERTATPGVRPDRAELIVRGVAPTSGKKDHHRGLRPIDARTDGRRVNAERPTPAGVFLGRHHHTSRHRRLGLTTRP